MSSVALDRIIKEVVDESLQEFKRTLESTREEALKIVDSTAEAISREVKEVVERNKRERESMRQRIISLAEITARNKSIAIIEEGINQTIQEALKRIEKIDQKELEDAIRKLVEEAIDTVGAKEIIVFSNETGVKILGKLVKKIESEKGVKIDVSDKRIDTKCGVKVMSKDGQVIYDNTVETRIERIRPQIRRELAKFFTGG